MSLIFPALAGGFFTLMLPGKLCICIKLNQKLTRHGKLTSCYSVTKLCPTFCDTMDCSTPGSSVLLYVPEFAQIHVH